MNRYTLLRHPGMDTGLRLKSPSTMILMMVALCTAALQAVTATRACGKTGLQSRIFGGSSVVPSEFPWHATLTYKGKPFCGGSLVSDRWVVTASHCFDRKANEDKRDPKLWQVHLGVTKMGYTPAESSAVTMVPSRIVIHENFTKYTNGFDIALVELPSPVNFTRFISPICLPESAHRFNLRRTCYATGLVTVPEDVPLDSKRSLQKVGQILIGWRTCNCIYNTHKRPDLSNPANPSMLCITEGDGKKGPCQGDSGGAVVCEEDGVWFHAGVISFSQGCHLLNSPTILSSASFYQDWIKQKTDNQASFSPQTLAVVDDVDNDTCSDLLSNHTAGCGISQVSDPSSSSPGTWPWQVDLWRDGKRTCSGALISDSWVITAAECFIGPDSSELAEDWSVTVASGTPAMRDIAVRKISIHGSYISPDKGYNLALVLLAQPVPLGPYTQAVCLPASSHPTPYGSSCWHIVGNNSHPDQTGAPHGEKLELLGPNQCNCIYSRPNSNNRTESVMEGMICASREGEKNSSQCMGDLGGPLVCKEDGTWFLTGVYNYGGECREGTDSTQPRVFTQLTTYEDWIDKETRETFFRPVISAPPPKPDTDRCSFDSPRGCGNPVATPSPEPIGEATDKMWPWQVDLQQFESHICSAVLISETWILTAARCIPSYTSLNEYTIILGRKQQNEPSPREVQRQIKKVVPHPDYKPETGENDAALVEMNYGVTFSDYILPVCLAPSHASPPADKCWVIGWGRVYPSDNTFSPPLRHLRVHLWDGKHCGSLENITQTGGPGQICAAANNTAFTCLLDDSTPLVCQPNSKGPWFVFGVGSQTSPTKWNPCPSNFTSVVPMLSWIREVVPKTDLSLLESNTTVPTPGYNETSASPNTTVPTPGYNETSASPTTTVPTPGYNETSASSNTTVPTPGYNETSASSNTTVPTPGYNETPASPNTTVPTPGYNETSASPTTTVPTPGYNETSASPNTTVPTPGYNETSASPTTTTATPNPLNTTLGPQSSNTTYRESDVSTKEVHNFTTSSTQSSCLEPDHGSGIKCPGHTTVPPQIQNSTLSSSTTTQKTGSTGNTTASGVDALWRSWIGQALLTVLFVCHYC
ncbi:polyserase-2-like isoform X2 [Rana temporaria]|uniref:polyserase-2-like isoform X2 n=1 Tax=Rana temporaria TaxID=8407 RepID=UPI001AAD243B|nr:polyserase-2-like isoform X2 [Rana temporaria]